MNKVLLIASGMSAKEVHDYDYKANGWTIVAINNGWRVTEDWDLWVHAGDFDGERPEVIKDTQEECKKYADSLKHFGGHKECGYSITLCASYYSLWKYKPDVMGFLGCDMNYTPDADGNTHIYGVGSDIKKRGIPDPDRMVAQYAKGNENYLNDLYMRLVSEAESWSNCKVYNLSSVTDTRLPYNKAKPVDFQ
jgi:hypothetical protein